MNTELKAKKHGLFNMKVDMTSGPLYKNYVIYTIPYIIALLIQNTYNAADMVILGRFASETAVAAVGATSSITSVVVNFFIGFAIGYNIVIVRLFGEKDKEELKRANSTAFIVSLAVGVALMILGLIFAEPLLLLVKCPASILSDSALYARIYFLSLPGLMFFNHFSSLVKATGDSVTSVYYLIVSAVSNIVLNLFFVVVLKMPVLGVAIATTTSIYVTAILCFIKVLHLDEFSRLELSGMRFSGEIFKKIDLTVTQMGKELYSGKIDASPTKGAHDACEYCPYDSVCTYRMSEPKTTYEIKNPEVFEILENNTKKGGEI
jgi:Na+-driven multidrug efflux pump